MGSVRLEAGPTTDYLRQQGRLNKKRKAGKAKMMNLGSNWKITIILSLLAILSLTGVSMSEDLSALSYKTVQATGSLSHQGESWVMSDTLSVGSWTSPHKEGGVEIIGILYPITNKAKPMLCPIEVKESKKSAFSIKEYKDPVRILGKAKPIAVQQHIIQTGYTMIDYFDGPFGQMVVYFKDSKVYNAYSGLSPNTKVALTGRLIPAFSDRTKRPGDKGGKKLFFGMQMIVQKVETLKK
jgi:hypothetical protein